MPSNFDAEKYAAECRAMDVNALLEEWYVRRWRIDESGVEWDYERISKDELLRRLNPGRVDELQAEIARLQTQLAACRREALEEAAKAVCYRCRNGEKSSGDYHDLGDGIADQCYAAEIHQLIAKEAHG